MKRAKASRHGRHGGAAVVATEHGVGAVGMVASDLGCRYADLDGRPARADVDAQCCDAGGLDGIGEKRQLVALGVRGANYIDALHGNADVGGPLHFFETRVSY